MLSIEDQIAQLGDAIDTTLQASQEPHADSTSVSGRRKRRLMWTAAAFIAIVGVGAVSFVVGQTSTSETGSSGLTPEQVDEMRADLDRRLPTATPSQQAALADGLVTVTEAMNLAQEASDCFEEATGRTISFSWNGEGLERSFAGDPDPDRNEQILTTADRCWEQHVGLAELYLALQQVRPVDEQQRLRALTIDCLRDAGIDAPDWPATTTDVDPSIEATCVDQADALLPLLDD